MSRYFVRPRAAHHDTPNWIWGPEPRQVPDLYVPEHTAVETGILDKDGGMVMRAPRSIGFGRDDE